MDETIDAWFAKHFHGLGSKLDTEVYNLIHAAKDDLKRILREPSSTTSTTTTTTASESEE